MVSEPTVSIKLEPHGVNAETDSVAHEYYEDVPLDEPSHPELLGRIDTFEIEKVIGRGGCGVVYKGFDRELNRPVAIKVLAPHLASNGIARQRFSREARAAAAVVHPNVVPIHGVSAGPERPYIVMSLVNGRSLEAHVREYGSLELKDIVRIARQIADGLAAAHRQGLIHRDIKPANILLEQDVSRVMITDFGLARAADDAAITQTGWLAGTPHYMSPEQAKGAEIDQRSDLFSLGSLIYFMSTGREPFRAEKPFAVIQKIINDTPEKARQVNSEVSKTLGQIIDRLLAKSPKDRFSSAEAVHETLEKYLAHLQNPLASPKPKDIVVRRKRIRAPILAMAAVVLLVFAGWYAFQTNGLFFSTPTQGKTVAGETISNESTISPSVGGQITPSAKSFDSDTLLTDDQFQYFLSDLANDISDLEKELGPSETPGESSDKNPNTPQVIDLSPSGLVPNRDNNP